MKVLPGKNPKLLQQWSLSLTSMSSYQKKLIALILVTTIVRLIFSATTELGNVEVYYWSWSVKPQWSYFDHPPMVAWMISLTTLGQLLVNEVTVRLGCVIAAALGTWLTFCIGKQIKDEQAGWFAALLYTCCIYTSTGAGIFVLPDSPQIVFWLWSLLLLLQQSTTDQASRRSKLYWLLFGLTAGMCMMSKVHGVFLWIGIIIYWLVNDRRQFKNPYVYLAAFISLAVISPIIIWNIQHQWLTWKLQGNRFNVAGQPVQIGHFFRQFLEVIFTIGPIPFFLVWKSIVIHLRRKNYEAAKQIQLLLFCSLPMIVILLVISVFKEVYPHWPAPAYAALLVLPALDLAENTLDKDLFMPKVLKWGLIYGFALIVFQPLYTNYYPGTSSAEKGGFKTGTGDETIDMVGWDEAGRQYARLYRDGIKNKTVLPGTPIIIGAWIPGAATEFYLARKTGQEVWGVGTVDSLHQYYFANEGKRPLKAGDDAYYIFTSNHFDGAMIDFLNFHFTTVKSVLMIPVYRSGSLCKQVYIFRVKGYHSVPFMVHQNQPRG